MNSLWSQTFGCQADDRYELLKSFLQAQGEILDSEAVRFLGFDQETIQPLLQGLVQEGAAAAEDHGCTRFYQWREDSPPQA